MEILGTLGINARDFIWQTINFIVLIALLSYFLYRPIVNMLDERSRRIQESLEAAERAQADVARADREREELLATTRREIGEMMAQAQSAAERIHSEARSTAQQEAQRLVETARQEANAERAQAMAELRREVASLAVSAAERVISRSLDDQTHRQLVEEFLDVDGQLQRLRCEGLLATAAQHEIDHLDGRLYVDYLPALKRLSMRRRAKRRKLERAEVAEPGASTAL